MNYNNIKIYNKQAEKILFDFYHIKGTAFKLPGETDFNFKITIDSKDCYILKISRPNQSKKYSDFQEKLLQYLEHKATIVSPKIILDKKRKATIEYIDSSKNIRSVRLLTWIPGRLWSNVNPQSNLLRFDLGKQCGKLTKTLRFFKHTEAYRNFDWDIAQSLWTSNFLHLFSAKEKKVISNFQSLFRKQFKSYQSLRKSIVHNDVNDNNIVVSEDIKDPKVIGAIDYGDAIHTQTINDLAIACSYAIMHHNDPLEASLELIIGYHSTFTLQEKEISHLYACIAMRLVISVTKSAINKDKEPNNRY